MSFIISIVALCVGLSISHKAGKHAKHYNEIYQINIDRLQGEEEEEYVKKVQNMGLHFYYLPSDTTQLKKNKCSTCKRRAKELRL